MGGDAEAAEAGRPGSLEKNKMANRFVILL